MAERTPDRPRFLDAGDERLTITLDCSSPVELAELTQSLGALARQHLRFADRMGASFNGDQVKLYVREIRQGSIIVDLVARAQQIGAFIDQVKTVVPFATALVDLFAFALGRTSEPPPDTTPQDAKDLALLVNPTALDPQGTMTIHAVNSTVTVHQVINSDQANAAQNRLNNFAARQQQPTAGLYESQLFYFARATGDAARQSGDRGVIERFTRSAVRTVFATPDIKQSPLTEPLFQKLYLVDVEVHTVDDRPVLYRITRLIQSYDRNHPV